MPLTCVEGSLRRRNRRSAVIIGASFRRRRTPREACVIISAKLSLLVISLTYRIARSGAWGQPMAKNDVGHAIHAFVGIAHARVDRIGSRAECAEWLRCIRIYPKHVMYSTSYLHVHIDTSMICRVCQWARLSPFFLRSRRKDVGCNSSTLLDIASRIMFRD
jgi:hypothetical protein